LSVVLVAQQNAQPVRNPLGGDPAVVAEGQSLFNQVCQSCHGPGGQGSDRGPALTRTTLTRGNADADVFRAIRTGVSGTQTRYLAARFQRALGGWRFGIASNLTIHLLAISNLRPSCRATRGASSFR